MVTINVIVQLSTSMTAETVSLFPHGQDAGKTGYWVNSRLDRSFKMSIYYFWNGTNNILIKIPAMFLIMVCAVNIFFMVL